MAKIIMWVIAECACVLCIGAAFWLAWNSKDGWGWFLFVAVLLTPSWSQKSDKKAVSCKGTGAMRSEAEPLPNPSKGQESA